MKKKIILAAVAATVMITTALPTNTFAATSYAVCNVDNCNKTGNHRHSNTWYQGHYLNDGHDYHQVCSVNNCGRTGTHRHSGTSYMGHHSGDGHGHYSNGTQSGRHHGGGRHH